MRPISLRKHVPTRVTAHAFVRGEASWGVGLAQYMSDDDRVAEVERVAADLLDVAKRFPRTRVLEYAILKAHLITESALTHFIRLTARVLVPIEEIRFTYPQKLQIAVLHGFAYGDPVTIPSLEMLNSVRNQVAHRFEFDRKIVDEFVRLNSEDYVKSRDRRDPVRIRCLRLFAAFLAGGTAGHVESMIHFTRREQPATAAADERRARGGRVR